MPTQKIGFLKGLDKDSDIRLLNNAYRDALNVRITDYESGDKFTIVNSKGNTEIEYTLPNKYNFVIGSFDDKVNKNVYYFVYNSKDEHSVLRYDYTQGVVELVLQSNGLYFTQDNLITGVALLDNRYLIWTDNNQEPMMIDIDNTNIYAGVNAQQRRDTLELAKKPQVLPTRAAYISNAGKKFNNLQGKLWQFRTVVEYTDGTTSDFGMISRLAIPPVDSQAYYTTNQDISYGNEIRISVPLPEFYTNNSHISGVKLYARGVNSDDNKTDNWYLFQEETIEDMNSRYSVYGQDYADYYFDNSEIYVLADPIEASQAQTFVPQKAKALDIIHGNRLALANTTDGYDNVNINASVSFQKRGVPSLPSASLSLSLPSSVTNEPSASVENTAYDIEINNSNSASGLSVDPSYKTLSVSSASEFDKVTFTLNLKYFVYNNTGSGPTLISTQTRAIELEYLADGDKTASEMQSVLAGVINSTDTRLAISGGSIGGIVATIAGRLYQGQSLDFVPFNYYGITAVTEVKSITNVTVTNLGQIATRPTFKKDAIHEFAIQYHDGKGRRSAALTSTSLKKTSPSYSSSTTNGGRVTAEIQVSNTPPSWAKYWSVLYTKNQSYDYILQFVGNISVDSGDIYNISLSDYIDFRTKNASSSINYSFVKGDIVKVLYSVGGSFTNSEEFEILSFDSANSDLKIRTSTVFNGDYIFEIRRPKKESSEKFYYEIGHTFEVLNPVLENGGLTDGLIGSIFNNTTTGTDGTYYVAPTTTSGSGVNAFLEVTVEGNTITGIGVEIKGSGYALGDTITIPAASIGSSTDVDLNLSISHGAINVDEDKDVFGNQIQTPTLPAIINLDDVGDAYYIYRPYYVDDYGVASGAQIAKFGESYHFSDYYVSDVTSIGRANFADEEAQSRNRKTAVVYSQPYIPESTINGISTFYGTSLEQYSTQYGSIQYIYSEGRRLFVFQENKVGQIGINEQFFLNGTQQTYQTETVLNPIQYYPAEYGIGQCPESFCVFGYRKYFVDALRSSVIRLSQDGLTPISDNGMKGFFNNILRTPNSFKNRLTYNELFSEVTFLSKPSRIDSGFIVISKTPLQISINKSVLPEVNVGDSGVIYYTDGGAEESSSFTVAGKVSGATTWTLTLQFTFPSSTYDVDFLEFGDYNVLTFSEEANAWVSRWSYEPEWMEEAGIGLVTFKNGKCYLHDSNTTRGRFYGTNYAAQVTVVANENPSYPKIFKTIQQESTTQWECPSILTLESQSSNLIDDDFEKIQNQWYASFWFDSNTPNVTHPLINGDPLRSTAMEIQMENDSTSEEKMFAVGVNYIVSNLSNDE